MFFAIRDTIRLVKWAPRHHLLGAAGGNGQLLLYDPIRQVRLRTLGPKDDEPSFDILSCCWLPSSTKKLVVLGSTSGCAEVWNVSEATLLRSYMDHSPEVKFLPPDAYPYRRSICAVAWSPNRTYIASAGDDRLVRVWRATTGETCCVVNEEPLRAGYLLSWLPDSKTLVSGTAHEVFVWDAFSGRVLHRFPAPLNYDYQGCRTVSPDGTKVAVTSSKVVIYDLATGESPLTYPMPTDESTDDYHSSVSNQIAWSPDGTRLAVSFHRRPKHIYVWDACTGETLFQHRSHEIVSCLDWSFDSQMLAWGGQGYLETLALPS